MRDCGILQSLLIEYKQKITILLTIKKLKQMSNKELEFLCAFARCNALEETEFNEVMNQYDEFLEYVECVCERRANDYNTDKNDEFWEFVEVYIEDYKKVEKEGFLEECALVCYGDPTLTIIEFDLN